MKKIIFLFGVAIVALFSCKTTEPISKSKAYKGLYEEKPLAILIMPPINNSTNVEAKEYFHSTLFTSLADAGYYVIPPFLSMEMLKKESAYDAEMFLETPLALFGEVFGADVALFTIIHKWEKSGLRAMVVVDVEYIFKSAKTNDILYTRRANVTFDTSSSVSGGGLVGVLVNVTASAINTAITKQVDVARVCNQKTFEDLPLGKYSPEYLLDGDALAGSKSFSIVVRK